LHVLFAIKALLGIPTKFVQLSWGNLWWPADLQRPHCYYSTVPCCWDNLSNLIWTAKSLTKFRKQLKT